MKQLKKIERRQYIRLQSVFPVTFSLLSPDGAQKLSEPLQGFTSDISKGGILLRVNNIDSKWRTMLEKNEAILQLVIDVFLGRKPIKATAKVAWITVIRENDCNICMIGLSFEKIDKREKKRLLGYTKSLYRMPRLMAIAVILLLFALGIDKQAQLNLMKENALLVDRLHNTLHKRSAVIKWLDSAEKEKSLLQERLDQQRIETTEIEEYTKKVIEDEEELKAYGEEMEVLKDLDVYKEALLRSKNTRVALQARLNTLLADKEQLANKLKDIEEDEAQRLAELEAIEKSRLRLEKTTLDNMYNWLKVHQNRNTGLEASYEGDRMLKGEAFIYDQSLVAQVFLLQKDYKRTRKILDFFKERAQKQSGVFANAYNVTNGGITEYTVHCGPNIWIGIAIMQYMHATGKDDYLDLAKYIGNWLIELQEADSDNGIRGGPECAWYSTEHNLDAYAFFIMLERMTGMKMYGEAAQKSLEWIRLHAYTESEGRMYRGKGDSTIATDTFAWAIAALGPKILIENDMDPNGIMSFAETNCKVTVDYKRPDGKTEQITGFDFAKHKNIGRGGVVSIEWTAQMIVSLRIMSDFYLSLSDYKTAKLYQDKSDYYINELEKMIITSPSKTGQGGGCLPYATHDNVDTGHGWRTPHGKDTGSVSGTAYSIFAIKGYNPLKLEDY